MGKQKSQTKAVPAKAAPYVFPPSVWTGKKPRTLGPPTTLLASQILLFDSTLLAEECRALVGLFDSPSAAAGTGSSGSCPTLEPSPAARRGEAQRTNHRFSTTDASFAAALFAHTGLAAALSTHLAPTPDGRRPVGLSANIRIYRYDPGAIFGPHYDDHATDPASGLRTEWTLLVYLTGQQDGVDGGQTVFYEDHARPGPGAGAGSKERGRIVAPLSRGTALLHRHGRSCMLHEALPPTRGTKWVLRSDVVFGR
ncbi:hypothetical protein FA10DRAFT_298705 [Acaromyces ingoldii]|uniref:Fe2OG dioxygenase domain-containing protein n=1 Tax=Acaromyces ingoldii TaxID=215250 RepID=A0A316YXC3_9BASI|nr:hypothetical protein FA10DRAFT_298705 [Acaromyces ingoldii]PWN93298.1 hypothetical protein FA10DRAFT_298705 [Acaromyces ingoldii]